MVRPHALVVPLHVIDKDDSPFVGGKAANLGEMLGHKFPVPPGFVVTADAYSEFLKFNKLDKRIDHLVNTINFARDESLNHVSNQIKRLINTAKIPDNTVSAIFAEYEKLGKSPYVAIRSSAIGEDSKEASFAGQNESFLNIKGEAAVVGKIREAWGSLFSPRSIFYRNEKNIPHLKAKIALVVQKMIESDASGVIFTQDPISGNKSTIIVEAILGLGEYIVQGKVTPDHYEVDKKTVQITQKTIAEQRVMLIKVRGENKEVKLKGAKGTAQKVKDYEVIALAKTAIEIEKHYYFPQDIEWAKEKGRIFIVQTRPVTTTASQVSTNLKDDIPQELLTKKVHPVLVGSPASPGAATGHVRKVSDIKDLPKVKNGDILVATATNPDFVPAMKRAAAIVTAQGGRTSHAAIIAREFGIPAVVGAEGAMSRLKDGEIVTVNGREGEVYRGGFRITPDRVSDKFSNIKTATKVFVNLAEPQFASHIASKNVDGVGLLRAEFIIAQIGLHPKKMIHDRRGKEFVSKLAEGISTIAKAFYPRPVYYRATDFKTNEYRNLTGGAIYEPHEENPMLGYRGAIRYIHDPAVFKLELEAIKKVRENEGLTNLQLMIPFVRTVKEFEEVKKVVIASGLRRSITFKLRMMAEVPSNVVLIEDFIKAGLDGVSIGSNDLTMLLLGVDRDNSEVASDFDERNPVVLWALEKIIKACKKNNIEVSICGQAPSVYPSLTEELVKYGISSISVSPDAIDDTRRIVYMAEAALIKRGANG